MKQGAAWLALIPAKYDEISSLRLVFTSDGVGVGVGVVIGVVRALTI